MLRGMSAPRSSAHTKGVHVELQHRILFLALMVLFLAQTYDGPDNLAVEAGTFELRVNFLDVVADRFLFFLKALDTLDEGAQLADGNGLGF